MAPGGVGPRFGGMWVIRVAVKMMFACFSFDLYQLDALRRAEVV